MLFSTVFVTSISPPLTRHQVLAFWGRCNLPGVLLWHVVGMTYEDIFEKDQKHEDYNGNTVEI